MPNIAALLKSEIVRVARKEIRAEVLSLRKTMALQKSQLAEMRRELASVQKALKAAAKATDRTNAPAAAEDAAEEDGVKRRFSPARLQAHRQKLGLSVAAYAQLVGVSSPTLRAWELGKRRPSDAQMKAVVAARTTKPVDE